MSNTPPLFGPPTLADALRSLPVPPLSADFDNRVLTALRVPVPWWRRFWQPAQPLLLGASGSLALTLLLLHFTLSGPPTAPSPTPASVQNLAAASSSGSLPSVDALLDRPGLCAGSLAPPGTARSRLNPSLNKPHESRSRAAGRKSFGSRRRLHRMLPCPKRGRGHL